MAVILRFTLASLLTILLSPTFAWIVPQPKANVWTTLARSMGQDHICLSSSSSENPLSTCLVGIPLKPEEFPPGLLKLKGDVNNTGPGRVMRSFLEHRKEREIPLPVLNPLLLWRDWASTLPGLPQNEEPQELELLGSSEAYYCVQFVFTPPRGQEKLYTSVYQVKDAYTAGTWCDRIAHVKMASTAKSFPLALPNSLFLICGDRAWKSIPARLLGGPCTLGHLGLFTPNKTQIMDWIKKNQTNELARQKRDLTDLDPDCDSEIIHWSRAKITAVTVFLPWVSIAKSLGELGRLECWVAKQANLTSQALTDLLADEEITRQATLQNRAAIDYLLLLHNHQCEEFEGLCCFNLSSLKNRPGFCLA